MGEARGAGATGGGGDKFSQKYFFDDFFLFILGYLVEFFGNFLDTWDTWPS
jgi:hypothetical protein